MTSRKSKFKFINRGFSATLLLIPGWATDYRVFDSLDLDFNYLLPVAVSPADFENGLLETIKKESLQKISILGWSMGGYMAADFASRHPQFVNDLTLIGMREKYDKAGIDKIKGYITKNKAGYLYKFYHECFASGENGYLSLFKKDLMKEYLKEFTTDELLEGLDYLRQAELKPETIEKVKTKLIHGDNDKIAPLEEIAGTEGLMVMNEAGHAPFLRNDFKKVFYGDRIE